MPGFAVSTQKGPAWDATRGRREQDGWDEHAAFMDGLVADGTVLLGGPVGDGETVLLAMEAADEDAVRTRMGADPWAPIGLLVVGEIRPWSLWLRGP
jgi:uncharacterized protein YciI